MKRAPSARTIIKSLDLRPLLPAIFFHLPDPVQLRLHQPDTDETEKEEAEQRRGEFQRIVRRQMRELLHLCYARAVAVMHLKPPEAAGKENQSEISRRRGFAAAQIVADLVSCPPPPEERVDAECQKGQKHHQSDT